ncbi:MAG: hypothetical protein HKN42_17785 [Granulosicoccus sp.]|nr:hypothetical protein [Granulosicoccus sp.]
MGSIDDKEEEGTFRQRLWGAAVFIAIMVIVLPLLLDGAGSESQFRRVEKLRQEPPSVVDADGNRSVQQIPEMRSVGKDRVSTSDPERIPPAFKPDIKIGEDDLPDYMKAESAVREELKRSLDRIPLSAWVVQAGSFNEQDNAVAVRDQLRRAGFASFIRDREVETDPYRVLVGPMISAESAGDAQRRVMELLGTEALILAYP